MERVYNENAAAFTWEIINDKEDIGSFEILYQGQIIKGVGFEEFLNAASNLSEEVNVIYIKHLKWFIRISQNFIDYSDKQFFANGDMDFYWVRIMDNVEVRNWDNFWKKIDDKKEFLNRLDLCRKNFNKGQKGILGLKNNYKYTLAREQYADIYQRYYLYCPWATNYCKEMVPKTQDELDVLNWLNKASFYYSNPNWYGDRAYNVHCYDLSSSHLSFFARKKFPYGGFQLEEDFEKIQEIIKKKFECWYGVFHFNKLQYKINFPVDLTKFGTMANDRGQCCYDLVLTNVDMEWFKEVFSWDSVSVSWFYHAPQRELCKDYAKMFDALYEWKNQQKKGSFAKEICKFRAELPFGQPMKKVQYDTKTVFNKETKEFQLVDNEEKSFKQIQTDIIKRGIPMQVSLWVAAYSRVEEFTMINRIGLDKVVYGDTDSVKFVGEEGVKEIERRNKEIEDEFNQINKKRLLNFNPKLGKWCDEGNLACFKSIGIKWYLTVNMDDKIDVKAAGANIEALLDWLKKQRDPISKFRLQMKVPKLFKDIGASAKTKYGVRFQYKEKMDSSFKKDILGRGTSLYYYNPYEEGEVNE